MPGDCRGHLLGERNEGTDLLSTAILPNGGLPFGRAQLRSEAWEGTPERERLAGRVTTKRRRIHPTVAAVAANAEPTGDLHNSLLASFR